MTRAKIVLYNPIAAFVAVPLELAAPAASLNCNASTEHRFDATEAQRSEAGSIGARMRHDFRDGTLAPQG